MKERIDILRKTYIEYSIEIKGSPTNNEKCLSFNMYGHVWWYCPFQKILFRTVGTLSKETTTLQDIWVLMVQKANLPNWSGVLDFRCRKECSPTGKNWWIYSRHKWPSSPITRTNPPRTPATLCSNSRRRNSKRSCPNTPPRYCKIITKKNH